jgi:hypothetical protein
MQAGDEESASVEDTKSSKPENSSSSLAGPQDDSEDSLNDQFPSHSTTATTSVNGNTLNNNSNNGNVTASSPPSPSVMATKGPSIWLWMFMAITYCFRLFSEGVFALVAYRTSLFWKQSSLKDFSAVAVQVHLRLKQACSWPINFILVKQHWATDLKKALAVEIK